MLKRDWVDYFIILVVLLIIGGFFYMNYTSQKKGEVRELNYEGYKLNIPSGFKLLSKSEKKNYGFAERIVVLSKGDMGHLIMVDVEKGLPLVLKSSDLDDYFKVTEEELRKNVQDIKFEKRTLNKEKKEMLFVYDGKVKEVQFVAAYFSKLDKGKKLNITISVPADQRNMLDEYLKTLRSSIE